MKTTIKLVAFLVLILSINACEQTTTDEGTDVVVTECPVDEILPSEALPMLAEAEVYIDSVNNSLEAGAVQIPYGARIPVCEMKEILEKIGDEPETWAMMAMEDGELTIIFQGKKEGTSEYVYYDFTRPCPDKCPD